MAFVRRCACFLTAIYCFPLSAQDQVEAVPDRGGIVDPALVSLQHVDYEYGVVVESADNFTYGYWPGMPLSIGDSVTTSLQGAELLLEASSTIVRIGESSRVGLQSIDDATPPRFAMSRGSLRIVAPYDPAETPVIIIETSLSTADILSRTEIAACDCILEYSPGESHTITVYAGEAVVYNGLTDETVVIPSGYYVDFFAEQFIPPLLFDTALSASADELIVSDAEQAAIAAGPLAGVSTLLQMQFNLLDPAALTVTPSVSEELPESFAADELQPADEAVDEIVETPAEEPQPISIIDNPVWDVLQVDGGLVPIEGEVYSLVSLKPGFSIGVLTLRFNLTIAYVGDLFDTGSWYSSSSSNEWTFGTDFNWQTNTLNALLDLTYDLVTKIDELSISAPGRVFELRLGSLEDISLGHGILVDGFSNTANLPLLRRQGLYMTVNAGFGGLQVLMPDIRSPQLFGARFTLSPFGPFFTLGMSSMVDLMPLANFANLALGTTVDLFVRPSMPMATPEQLLQAATDLQNTNTLLFPAIFPIAFDLSIGVETPEVAFTIFSEVALLLSVSAPAPGVEQFLQIARNGLDLSSLILNTAGNWIRNVASTSGVEGRFLFFVFRADLRTYSGSFRPGFFGTNYLRQRSAIAGDILSMTNDPSNERHDRFGLGLYLEPGFTFFDDQLQFGIGFYTPLEWGRTTIRLSPHDTMRIWLDLLPGLLPVYARLDYMRNGFIATIAQTPPYQGSSLFDGNATYRVTLGYSLLNIMRIEIFLNNAVTTRADGTIDFVDGRARTTTQFGIMARIGRH